MSLPLSDLLLTTFEGGLGTLQAVVAAAQVCEDGAELVDARLVDDMFTFRQQVQAATDTARRVVDRLSGREPSSKPDPEPTLDALAERIAETIDHVKAGDAAAIDATASEEMMIDLGAGPMPFTGRSYVLGFALPNFLFHVTTGYDILRHRGVQLGKIDYIRPFIGATQAG